MAANPPGDSSSRQKVIAVVVVIVFLIIAWQVFGIFRSHSGGASSPTIAPATRPMNPNTAGTTATTSVPGRPTNPVNPTQSTIPTMAPTQPAQAAAEPPPLRETTVSVNPQLAALQQTNEEAYIEQLNKLQNLKIQREIAETNQAIAVAKLATVTAEKNVSDLLTKPATPPGPVLPPGMTAGILAGPPIPPPHIPTPPAKPVTAVIVPTIPEVNYTVVSVAMELGRWSAILSNEGRLYNVTVGDVLPPDGSRVISINRNAVTLGLKGKRRTISMVPTINTNEGVEPGVISSTTTTTTSSTTPPLPPNP